MNAGLILGALATLAPLAFPTLVRADGPAELTPPEAIAQMVDVRSFPSSIGPRLQDDLKTFADYGFTDVTVVDKSVELYEPDRSWVFVVTVLEADIDRVVLCILDRALGGPTYNAQKPLVFVLGDGGLLAATDELVENPACPTFPENG
jgi:hypothetical protein